MGGSGLFGGGCFGDCLLGYGVSFSLVGFVVATGFLIAGLACKSAWAIVWCELAGLSLADLRC